MMPACSAPVEADLVAAYAHGQLAPGEAAALAAHLDGCAECRWLVYAAAATGTGDREAVAGTLRVGDRIGRYEIEAPIGAGGMGVVYRARDRELGRAVALKVVRTAGAPVLAEAQAIARVTHPNVIAVYEVVPWGDQQIVVMELVPGEPLPRWLARAPRAAAIVDVFAAAAAGLAAIHDAGLVHGDIKPPNLLVGDDGRVRITDFGLARDAGHAGAALGGTPGYLAPELARGAPPSAASDQFALCRSLDQALPHAGRRVRRVIARGLAVDPAARFPSLHALRTQLVRRPWRAPRLVGAGAACAVVAVIVLRGAEARAVRERCAARAPVSPWTASLRADVRTALGATGAYGAEAADTIDTRLGTWSAAFTAETSATCAGHAAGTRSADEVTTRFGCLAAQAAELRALTGELRTARRATVSAALVAVSTLEAPAACRDPRVALAVPAPAQAREVAEIRAALAEVRAVELVGVADRAPVLARAALARAEGTGFLPVIAEATLRLGSAQLGTAEAATTLERAIALADRAGDDGLRARAAMVALRAEYELGRTDRSPALAGTAITALARQRAGVLAWAELHHELGMMLVDRGEVLAGEIELAQALVLRTMAGTPGRTLAARSLAALGVARATRGEIAGARTALEAAARTFERELGPHHPRVAGTNLTLGQLCLADLDAAAARTVLARALPDLTDEPAARATAEDALGFAATELGEPARALEHHVRALAIWRGIRVDHPRAALSLLGEGQGRLARGDFAGAVRALEAALAVPPRSASNRAEINFALARALTGAAPGPAGPPARARTLAREAAALYAREGASDPHHRRERDRIVAWLGAPTVTAVTPTATVTPRTP